ncbi:MAG: PAS domain S-box protein [Nitrospinae bacterium]|nr:PAS domain S-box protein [Nitrospinota bacterium]
MKFWQIVLLSVLASEILTGLVVVAMDLLLHGVVTWDFMVTGAVAAFIVSLIIAVVLTSALRRLVEQEAVLRKAENDRDENRERYKQIFQQAADYILILESAEGGSFVIAEASDSAFEKHGYTRDEMLGKPITFLVSEKFKTDSQVRERFELIRSGRAVKFETEHVRKDGSIFNAEVAARMITINGKSCVFTVERDITDRKELEKRQLELLSAVEHALAQARTERNNAVAANKVMSGFIANISHELNTPLTSVLGYSHLAIGMDEEISKNLREIIGISQNTLSGAGTHGAALDKIAGIAQSAGRIAEESARCDALVKEQGQRLHMLLSDLVDLSVLEAGRAKVEKLAVSTHLLLDSLERGHGKLAAEKNLALRSNAGDLLRDDLVFLGDAKKMGRVLEHLVENAIKYSGRGDIRVTAGKENGNVVFRVRDEGMGISHDERDKIFETFRQLDGSSTRAQGGLGLGLSLARKLTSVMGGSLGMTSEVGKGSEFTVSIPYESGLPDNAV